MKQHGRRIMVQHDPGPLELPPQWGVSTAGPRTNANGPWEPGTPAPWTQQLSSVATWHPVRTDPAKAPPPQDQETTHPKARPSKIQCSLRGARQSVGERGFISSSEPSAAPHAPRPIPKVALIMYSQAAIISTRDQLWPCHGKQKATLRLTRAVSICEVYIKKTQNKAPQNWNKSISLHVLIPISFPHANAQTFAQTFSHAPALNPLFSVITQTDYLLPPWAQIPVLFRSV